MTSLLREPVATRLHERLAAAPATLAPVARVLLAPADSLAQLDRLAGPALRNDAVAVLRLRALLRVARGWAVLGAPLLDPPEPGRSLLEGIPDAIVLAAVRLSGSAPGHDLETLRIGAAPASSPPGGMLLSAGAFLELALAATRAAATPTEARAFLRVALGLALGLAGLETLARGEPPGLDDDTFAGWLATLGELVGDLRGPAGTGATLLVLGQDPGERARWLFLTQLGWIVRVAISEADAGMAAGGSESPDGLLARFEQGELTRKLEAEPAPGAWGFPPLDASGAPVHRGTWWDAAWADTVRAVDPARLAPDARTAKLLTDAAEVLDPTADNRPVVGWADGHVRLQRKQPVPPGEGQPATRAWRMLADRRGAGWAGLTSDAAVERTARWRTLLAASLDAWARRAGEAGSPLAGALAAAAAAVPVALAEDPTSPGFTRAPPVEAANRFVAEAAVEVRDFSVAPTRVRKGEPVRVTWDVAGAEDVRVTVREATGSVPDETLGPAARAGATWTPRADGRYQLALSATVGREPVDLDAKPAIVEVRDGPRILSVAIDGVRVWPPAASAGEQLPVVGTAAPVAVKPDFAVTVELDATAFRGTRVGVRFGQTDVVEAGAARVEARFEGAATGSADDLVVTLTQFEQAVDDARVPLRVEGRGARTVVLLTPSLEDAAGPPRPGVAAHDAVSALGAYGDRVGVTLDVRALPVVPDALATVPRLPAEDDGLLPELFEAMEALALRSPGGEQATWLVLLPDGGNRAPFARVVPGVAARWLAIATVSGAPAILAALAKDTPPSAASGRYLRVEGVVGRDGAVFTELREEERGAPEPLRVRGRYAVVLRDAAGRERGRLPLASSAYSGAFRALLPTWPEVDRLDVVDGPTVLGQARRPAVPTDAALVPGPLPAVRWTFAHPDGAPARPTAEVGDARGDLWTPLTCLDGCVPRAALPLGRLAAPARLRLALGDGWNVRLPELDAPVVPGEGDLRVVLRRLRDGRWWADTDPSDKVQLRWWFAGRPARALDDLRVVAAPFDTPFVRVEVRLGHDRAGADERVPAPCLLDAARGVAS